MAVLGPEVQARIRTEVKAQLRELGLRVVTNRELERLRTGTKAEITDYVESRLGQFKVDLDVYSTNVDDVLDDRLSYYYDGDAVDAETDEAKTAYRDELGDRDVTLWYINAY